MKDKDDDELFTCAECGKVIKDKTVFDVICCELPEELKSLFPKCDEGRVTNILLGMKVLPVGIPAKDSEAARGGADITFMTCGDKCRAVIEEILENSGLNVEAVDKGEG